MFPDIMRPAPLRFWHEEPFSTSSFKRNFTVLDLRQPQNMVALETGVMLHHLLGPNEMTPLYLSGFDLLAIPPDSKTASDSAMSAGSSLLIFNSINTFRLGSGIR